MFNGNAFLFFIFLITKIIPIINHAAPMLINMTFDPVGSVP